MKLGFIADIHGNDVALRAVLNDAALDIDRWWALGDLVLFGPRPAEVLEVLLGLPGIGMLRGNTDWYVLTDEQPAPHETATAAAGVPGLVERLAAMAAGIAWTRGVVDQAGLLDVLAGLPAQLPLLLPDGAAVLGVHASLVAGGHTHVAADRLAGSVRALNPGSTGMPRTSGTASWLLLEAGSDGLVATHRSVPYDVDAVVDDLRRRLHPNREFAASILTGRRQQTRAPSRQ